MFLGLVKDHKFIPSIYKEIVYDVDYIKLYESGIRLILTDLDNTLVSYKDDVVSDKLRNFINELKSIGFEVMIISNNSSDSRVKEFSKKLDVEYIAKAMKPLKGGFKKILKKASRKYSPNEVVAIGDQLMTDVFAANRMNYTSILVKAIDRKTEKWTTRFNRVLEKHVLKRLKNKYKDLYDDKLRFYKEENYGRD